MSDLAYDHHLPEEWIDRRMPWDDFEHEERPSDLIRDARLKTVELLNGFANRIERALAQPDATVKAVASAFWGPAYGMGLNCCEGVSMSDRAEALGLERAAISKGATAFDEAFSLPPSWYMKAQGASDSYAAARVSSIERNNARLEHKRAKPFKTPPALPNEAIESNETGQQTHDIGA